jgi:hypothetical protein
METTIDNAQKLDFEAIKKGGMLAIATALANPSLSEEDKYKLGKMMMDVTKEQVIDPLKGMRDREKEQKAKEAEDRAAKVAEFRDRIAKLINEEVLEEFGTIGADFISAGHGTLVSVELYAKKDEATGEVKAEFTSNIAKPRAHRASTSTARDRGPSGAGVIVEGSAKEGVKTVAGEPGPTIEATHFDSFADAARKLGFVSEDQDLKGVNCKRLLEGKGYTCKLAEAAPTPAPEEAPTHQ